MEIRPILSTLLRHRTGPLLVALQVALSLAILANAIFVVQQRVAASQRPSGVADEDNVGYLFVQPMEKRSHPDRPRGAAARARCDRGGPGRSRGGVGHADAHVALGQLEQRAA
jgi:putative ABC transport system permease protein